MAKKTIPNVTTKAPTRQMWRRSIIVLVLIVGVCFSAVVGKLAILQIAETDEWQKRAVSQQLSDSVTTPKRGSIYDANMRALASSAEVWKIIMSPKDIEGLSKDVDWRTKIADELSVLLTVDREKLYAQTGKTHSQYEVIQSKVEHPLKQQVSQWILDNRLSGVFTIIPDYKRYYPFDSLLSNVLGFTGTENTGLEGLEATYESVLAGKPGRIVTAKNGWGEDMPTEMDYAKIVDAEDGKSLVLTVDESIQHFAEKYLELAVKETGTKNRGIAIVQDVNTGGILALAIKGDYNPNEPFVVTDPGTQAMLAALAGDEKSKALTAARQAQWKNKAITDTYEPGSVFKVFTGCMALEEGVATESTSFFCTGSLTVKGWPHPIKCHQRGGHGATDFPKAISVSCNPYFMNLGLKLGGSTFFKYFSAFGFTAKTGIDMIGEQSNAGLYHSEKTLSNPDRQDSLATMSFGQTFKVTPMQMITAMSAVANGGKLLQPYVVQQIIDSKGNVIKNTDPVVKRQVISKDTAARMGAMMAASTNGGGAKNAYVAGYRVAGKTGTSEKRDTLDIADDVVASFSGFAPADDPRISVLVLLDDPQSQNRFGGTISAPVAQKIMESALPYMGVEPKYTKEEQAAMNRITPTVEKKELTAAKTALANSGLKAQVLGGGSTVLKQMPEPGKPIPKEGTVVLYTEEDTLAKTTIVPDFKGKTLAQANLAAVNANLNMQLSGIGLDSGEAKGTGQSIPAGQKVPLGTVITVTFLYEDISEN